MISVLSYNDNSYIEEEMVDLTSYNKELQFPRNNIQLGKLYYKK